MISNMLIKKTYIYIYLLRFVKHLIIPMILNHSPLIKVHNNYCKENSI